MPVYKMKPTPNGDGGLQLVNELPEVGNPGLLYKTPDGKIWSCTNTTETETVCDLEVGKSYVLKDKILAGDIVGLCDTLGEGKHPLGISDDSGVVAVKMSPEDTSPVEYNFVYAEASGRSENVIGYDATNVPLTDLVTAELMGFTEIPSVTITQLLVDNLTTADLELLDLAFLFVDGSHTEEVTTSTWTEVGSSGGASGVTQVAMTYNESKVTLSATTEQIFNMLQNGIVVVTGKYYDVNYNAIIVDGYYSEEFGYDFFIISQSDRILSYNKDSDSWSIVIPG